MNELPIAVYVVMARSVNVCTGGLGQVLRTLHTQLLKATYPRCQSIHSVETV